MAKRILIIDDDEDILDILNIIFQDEGYEVIISNTAHAADYIHQINPDVMLLDIRLAGSEKTGAEICRDIKNAYPAEHFPVILVSAEANISLIASYCGADAFVSKPFDIFKLIKKVEELIPV
jgi:two-component system response regulator VicR